MRLNPPKKVTFWVSIFAFVIGTVLSLGVIPAIPIVVGLIISMLAYLLLVLGLLIKGL